jgi:hypothetical protein
MDLDMDLDMDMDVDMDMVNGIDSDMGMNIQRYEEKNFISDVGLL